MPATMAGEGVRGRYTASTTAGASCESAPRHQEHGKDAGTAERQHARTQVGMRHAALEATDQARTEAVVAEHDRQGQPGQDHHAGCRAQAAQASTYRSGVTDAGSEIGRASWWGWG
ncbi:hypothetical protein G6F55_014017 [Rhizopus delemar]|nr:hypothetical protein G6F55_014017 [Rhizopus delemar]